MSTKIRLARGGTKKRPFYRIVVADVRSPRDGKFIAILGTYNPLLEKDNPLRCKIDNLDLVKDWLAKGAQPTERVAKIMQIAGVALPESVQKRLSQIKNNPKKAPKKEAKE